MGNRAKLKRARERGGAHISSNPLQDFSGFTHDEVVALLARPHQYKAALQHLMNLGPNALDALKRGLAHDAPTVRVGCIRVLDRCMDDTALPDLIRNLDHPAGQVRAAALHTLACDRCKEGSCRPAEAEVTPRVARMLLEDEDVNVRAMAADMLGPSVKRNPVAASAINRAYNEESSRRVKKVLSWWIPGGPRYNKLKAAP